MRPLIIGPDEQAAIGKVVAYAMEPVNHYDPRRGDLIPGVNPNFCVDVPRGFHCVFTFTRHTGDLFRHLTVSIPDAGRRPSPEACIMLAKEFGFTASDDRLDIIVRMERDGWLVSEGHEGENCIVLVQPTKRGANG